MSKQPALSLRYSRDDDGTGELFAKVQYLGFSGHSSAWFNSQKLISYSKSLRDTFPFTSDTQLKLEGGYWKKSGAGIDELHLGLSFYPIGSAGLVGCHVQLLHDMASRDFILNMEIQTSYEAVRKFSLAFDRVILGEVETAELESIS